MKQFRFCVTKVVSKIFKKPLKSFSFQTNFWFIFLLLKQVWQKIQTIQKLNLLQFSFGLDIKLRHGTDWSQILNKVRSRKFWISKCCGEIFFLFWNVSSKSVFKSFRFILRKSQKIGFESICLQFGITHHWLKITILSKRLWPTIPVCFIYNPLTTKDYV